MYRPIVKAVSDPPAFRARFPVDWKEALRYLRTSGVAVSRSARLTSECFVFLHVQGDEIGQAKALPISCSVGWRRILIDAKIKF